MRIEDIFTSANIALYNEKNKSNDVPFMGLAFFPEDSQIGVDLKWITTKDGLPVSLMPSAYDTKSTIRSREGFSTTKTNMPYFKESMIVDETDELQIERLANASDPYAPMVMRSVYNDAERLIAGAQVVAERMRMQLLAAEDGSPKISLGGDGVTYNYDYDPDGTYKTNNYAKLTGTSMWSDTENSNPLEDVRMAKKAIKNAKLTRMVVSDKTMGYLVANKKVREALLSQNLTATVLVDESVVKAVFKSVLGVDIYVYDKEFVDEKGVTSQFYPDGMATLLPASTLGVTMYGTTPDSRLSSGSAGVIDHSIVGKGISVTVTQCTDPVCTKSTVSETVLPTFPRMAETYQIKCY